MNRSEIDGWIEALKKCIEQESYGDSIHCSLCIYVRKINNISAGVGIESRYCYGSCICYKFADIGCAEMLFKKTGDTLNTFNSYKPAWRECCDDMIAWLKTLQADDEPCAGCEYLKTLNDYDRDNGFCYCTHPTIPRVGCGSYGGLPLDHYDPHQTYIHAHCPGKSIKRKPFYPESEKELWGVKGTEHWLNRNVYGKGYTKYGFSFPCRKGWWATKDEALVAIEKSSHESNEFIPVRVTPDGKEIEKERPKKTIWSYMPQRYGKSLAQEMFEMNRNLYIGWDLADKNKREEPMSEEKTITLQELFNAAIHGGFDRKLIGDLISQCPKEKTVFTARELWEWFDEHRPDLPSCTEKGLEELVGPRPEKMGELTAIKATLQDGGPYVMEIKDSDEKLICDCGNAEGDYRKQHFKMILMVKLYEKFRKILENHSPGETIAIPYATLLGLKEEAEKEAGIE